MSFWLSTGQRNHGMLSWVKTSTRQRRHDVLSWEETSTAHLHRHHRNPSHFYTANILTGANKMFDKLIFHVAQLGMDLSAVASETHVQLELLERLSDNTLLRCAHTRVCSRNKACMQRRVIFACVLTLWPRQRLQFWQFLWGIQALALPEQHIHQPIRCTKSFKSIN